MDNQENESAAERELRLLIHQSIVGGVSRIGIITLSLIYHLQRIDIRSFEKPASTPRRSGRTCHHEILFLLLLLLNLIMNVITFRSLERVVSESRRSERTQIHLIIISIIIVSINIIMIMIIIVRSSEKAVSASRRSEKTAALPSKFSQHVLPSLQIDVFR